MALETGLGFDDQLNPYDYDYEYGENVEGQADSTVEEDLVRSDQASATNLLSGIGSFVESNYTLLFFFLLLVIIFNGSGNFHDSNESLLFFFLILVIIFNQFY